MSLILFKIKSKEIIPTEEIKLGKEDIYIIIDKHIKRSKIWIWSGSNSSISDKYYAGVSATKIKTKEKLYGASIEVVEAGHEPENFPILSKENIIEPIKTAKSLTINLEEELAEESLTQKTEVTSVKSAEAVEEVVEPPIEEIEVESVKLGAESVKETKLSEITKSKDTEILLKEDVKGLLKDISLNLEKIINKINTFVNKL